VAFENNQQDAFNLRNDTESLKLWQSELDKATTSIGAAEVAAEEELAKSKFKNLDELQKARLKQLDQLIAQENEGIRDLARARLTLSDRQFELRKKEIQKEFQLAKKATEDLLKISGKASRATEKKPTSATKDITTASTKTKNTDTVATKAASVKSNGAGATTSKERKFSSADAGLKSVDLSKYLFDDVRAMFEASQAAIHTQSPDIEKILNSVVANNKTPQASVDLAGDLLSSFESAENAIKKVRDFNEKRELNKRLTMLTEEQKLRAGHDNAEYQATQARLVADAKANDIARNEDAYKKETLHKLELEHANKENDFRLLSIIAAEEAEERKNNRGLYLQEAFWAQMQELSQEQKRQDNEQAKAEGALKFQKDPNNASKLMDLEAKKLKISHTNAETKEISARRASEAKANDLKTNEADYYQEAISSQLQAYADEQNKLELTRINNAATLDYMAYERDNLIAQDESKLARAHEDAAIKAQQANIAAIAKANDLENNRGLYLQEAFWSRQNAFADEQNKLRQALIDAETNKDFQKDPANTTALSDLESDKVRLAHINAEGDALSAIRAADAKAADLAHNKDLYIQEEKWALEKAYINTQNKLIEDRIKTEAAQAYTRANRDNLIAQEAQKLQNAHEESAFQAMQEHIAIAAKAEDLKNNKELYAHEENRKLNLAFLAEQNKLTEESIQAESKLQFIKNNEGRLLDQAAYKLRIAHAKAEREARQALIDEQAKADDIKFKEGKYLAEAALNLRLGHTKKENELRLAGINAEAKANDLKNNRGTYALEARLARENAFYEERNRLEEDRIKAEEEITWNAAHAEELMAQELQKKRLGYLQDYQKLQLEAGEYAVSLEEYKADQERKRNKAAKKEAVNGMVDGLKKFRTGEFSMADIKQSYGKFIGQRTAELKDEGLNDTSAMLAANFELLAEAAGNLSKELDAKVKEISSMQGIVDTRLQGSRANDRDFGNGSYWNQLLEDAKKIAGASPFIKQEKLVDNIKVLVERGISFDIKQRAFLMTIQEKIANTFDVADGTLLRLIRIQQQDTTAGRLGMESALNDFLNRMYETSEYLSEVAAGVRSSLEEMQALMDATAATEVEFQVQKWMGSLYSVGMSKGAVDSIAQAFGQIASGDVSGLTGSGAGNLLIMAANEAGMSIADILQDGLNADETNQLMQAMVNYLAEIAETSSDSRVVQQQLASVYGVKASDMKAATNLAISAKEISNQELSYGGMLGQLESMMNTIRFRTSIGEGMTNRWDNMMYSMASTQASNPTLYLLPKVADLLRDVTGGSGIALPGVSVMGNMVDLHTSVADLMSVASMAGTALGSLGPVLTGLADLANPWVGSSMLKRAGIDTSDKAPVIARGSAQPLQYLKGLSISESGLVGNADGMSIKEQTLQGAEDSKKKQMVEAKDEESADDVAIRAQQATVDIYNLLEEVAHGSQSLRVRIVNTNGFNSVGGSGGNTGSPIGDGSGDGSTGAYGGSSLANGVNSGAGSGNWVLSF
jgi:hypothetical protein